MREGTLLRLLLLVGIAANLALLAINIRPERPHLGTKRSATVLLREGPVAAKWIEGNELVEFGRAHDIDLKVVTAPSYEEIMKRLEAERDSGGQTLLTVIDDEHSDDVRAAKTVRPFDGAVPPEELSGLDEFLTSATRFCRTDGKTWFWPRRGEMTIGVSLKPAIEEAYLNWQGDEKALDAALKEANGIGLPRGYHLEKEPGDWDSYDLFVAAWYWANHPAPWADPLHPGSELTKPAPRIAWRTGNDDDAAYDLLGLFYRHGMKDEDLGRKEGLAELDALQWEALMRKHHLLVPEAEDPKGLSEDQLNELFKAGRLAWAPMDQEDSFWLHGGARRDAAPGITRPQRLDWSSMPAGASLELKDGAPARLGRSYAFQRYELWAIPARSADPALAVELVKYLTAHGMTLRETEALGMMPARVDIQESYPILFRLQWMQNVLDASYHQMSRGTGQMPEEVAAKHLDDRYTALRAKVLAMQPLPVSTEAIRRAVEGASDVH